MDVVKMSLTLVTYFSITGVTENAAIKLARAVGADLFEICSQKPCQPGEIPGDGKIVFTHKDISAYDRIFVGLPIWWYAAPTIIHDFLSDYDLRGKLVVPFVTSGGGGLDKVRPRLLESCPGADLREATLLSDDMSDEELREWADSYKV